MILVAEFTQTLVADLILTIYLWRPKQCLNSNSKLHRTAQRCESKLL